VTDDRANLLAQRSDWKQLIEKIGSDGHYRHWLKSIVGAAARRGAGENETAQAINEAVIRMGVPLAKIHEHFEVRDIGRMYRHFASGDQRQREEDDAFEQSAMEILDRANEQTRLEDIDGVEDAVDADPEAEEELRSWLDRLRTAKAKENRNALAYNAGKRLMRFVNAGRLDKDRVLTEIDATLDTREATP
jgi:hypothetical protein